MNDDGLRRARAAGQLLHRPGRTPDVADLVGRLLALQAQDTTAARLALRARASGLTAAGVDTAITDRSVIRAWGPRGTLHLVATADLSWLLPLVGPPRVTGSMRRLAQLGVPGDTETLTGIVVRVLAGQGPLTKAELGRLLNDAGVPATGQAIVHLAALGAVDGRVLLGPDRAGRPTYVHAADWLGHEIAPEPDRDRAVAELARRYLRSRGPAEPADLATWSGLPLRDARAGWAAVGAELVEVAHRDRMLYRLRGTVPAAPATTVRLLPAFDEYLLSWRDRDLVVSPQHARTVHPGGGIVHPTVIADGHVVGTWRLPGGKPVVTLFDDPAAHPDLGALDAERADVPRFLARTS